jgi:hypothetical protein
MNQKSINRGLDGIGTQKETMEAKRVLREIALDHPDWLPDEIREEAYRFCLTDEEVEKLKDED